MLETVNPHPESRGIKITAGTIVDATIIHAPSSTKNREQKCDPEMHQTRKRKQWNCGMNAHVGVDSKMKIIHSVVVAAANIADSAALPDLLRGDETKVWGDQAYRAQGEAIHEVAPPAQDLTNKRYRDKNRVDEVEREKNRTKSQTRSRVEHVFAVLKLKFGYTKVRYREIRKNANQAFTLCALSNLFLLCQRLLYTQMA
ncbi:MAG: IS5 family transposase [Candidatus Korobacteraceae bacterium]|jgi:IS5 family transposase